MKLFEGKADPFHSVLAIFKRIACNIAHVSLNINQGLGKYKMLLGNYKGTNSVQIRFRLSQILRGMY